MPTADLKIASHPGKTMSTTGFGRGRRRAPLLGVARRREVVRGHALSPLFAHVCGLATTHFNKVALGFHDATVAEFFRLSCLGKLSCHHLHGPWWNEEQLTSVSVVFRLFLFSFSFRIYTLPTKSFGVEGTMHPR